MNRKNFTFVELVFTLTVLAATALLTLSSFAHIRAKGKEILCQKQLGDLGKLALSYNETYKSIAMSPRYTVNGKEVVTDYLYLYWCLGLISKQSAIGSPGSCYLAKEFFCPSLMERNNISKRTFAGKEYYSSNCTYGSRTDTRNAQEGKNNHWARTYFDLNNLKDPAGFNFYGCATRLTTKRAIRFYYSRMAKGNIDFLTAVHENKAAVWTMDGKTHLITREDLAGKFGGNRLCWIK